MTVSNLARKSAFFLQNVFMVTCCILFSEQTAIISLNINKLAL